MFAITFAVAAVLVPEQRRDLLELDLTELTYG